MRVRTRDEIAGVRPAYVLATGDNQHEWIRMEPRADSRISEPDALLTEVRQ